MEVATRRAAKPDAGIGPGASESVHFAGRRPRVDPWRDYWTCRQKISKRSYDAIIKLAP